MSLTGGRGRSGIGGGVSILSDTSSPIASGWAVISSVDTVSSGVRGQLRLNSGDSTNGDSGNILIRTCVSSYDGEKTCYG